MRRPCIDLFADRGSRVLSILRSIPPRPRSRPSSLRSSSIIEDEKEEEDEGISRTVSPGGVEPPSEL
jgi:hypothetical protein